MLLRLPLRRLMLYLVMVNDLVERKRAVADKRALPPLMGIPTWFRG